jgi:hypothetical protein
MYKKGVGTRHILIILVVVGALVLITAGIVIKLNKVSVCNDGTLYDTCSDMKPYYCDSVSGKLIEKASLCGCNEVSLVSGESCVSDYQTLPEQISLSYVLRGQEKEIGFTVYKSGYDYVLGIPREIFYQVGEVPLREDFKLKSINEEEQRELLLPLVVNILNEAETKEDAVRIAVSIAQNIEYSFSNKTSRVGNLVANYSRYPYEVLYEQAGICGEKSALLAFFLKEMGYGTAILYFPQENHEAMGAKCPIKESFSETGYCFVETSGPAVISDGFLEYEGGTTLSSPAEVIVISEGESLGKSLYEYRDARILRKIRNGGFVLFRNSRFETIKEKYGLVEAYNLA